MAPTPIPIPRVPPNGGSDRQRDWHGQLPIAISIVALLVACAAAAFTLWQMMVTRGSQRAFIHASGPQVLTVVEDKAVKAVNFAVVFTNSGNTPTRNLMYFVRCATSKELVPEPWDLIHREKVEKLPQLIGPYATASAQCGFTANQMEQMSEGKLFGYVLGDVSYNDRRDAKTLRRTQFSWRLTDVSMDPAGDRVALTAVNDGQHNCEDDDCPLAIMTR
jgi:hypothetical protein